MHLDIITGLLYDIHSLPLITLTEKEWDSSVGVVSDAVSGWDKPNNEASICILIAGLLHSSHLVWLPLNKFHICSSLCADGNKIHETNHFRGNHVKS